MEQTPVKTIKLANLLLIGLILWVLFLVVFLGRSGGFLTKRILQ